jgi:hypothetical protein
MSSNNAPLTTDTQIYEFVKKAHDEVVKRLNDEKVIALREALKESRDAVLESIDTPPQRHFGRRLCSSEEASTLSDLLLCRPCGNSGNSASDSVVESVETLLPQVTVKFHNARCNSWKTTRPAIPLEGTHDPRPPGTTPAFLKAHFATDDERDLSHVPYFSDDDADDVVSDLYDTKARERMVALGPECRQHETYRIIEETLRQVKQDTRGTLSDDCIEAALAKLMDLEVDLIRNRHEHKEIPSPDKEPVHETEYLAAVDSYRQCFCRRCFTYDCNVHGGCQSKPDIKIQGELAMEKERSGFWKMVSETESFAFLSKYNFF